MSENWQPEQASGPDDSLYGPPDTGDDPRAIQAMQEFNAMMDAVGGDSEPADLSGSYLREHIDPARAGRIPNDPFEPYSWNDSPEWAEWHAIDPDGTAWWFALCPEANYYYEDGTFGTVQWLGWINGNGSGVEEDRAWNVDIDVPRVEALDWRNSLRARPPRPQEPTSGSSDPF